MHARLALAATVLLLLAGCADMPEATYEPAAVKPVFDPQAMQPLRTSDPDEIRRRWGDYELLIGETFVSDGKNPVEMAQTRWVVKGALSRTDWMNCYESTRKCDESWYWIQYDGAQRRLNFLHGDGSAWAHGEVQADGSVKVTRPTGAPYEVRFDFDKDEGVFWYPTLKKTNRYLPTDGTQYAEARKTWKQVDAETRAEEQRIAQARAAQAAEEAAARRRAESAESAERWSRAMSAFGQAYSDTMAQHRRQQAETAARNARLAAALQSSRPSTPSPTTSSAPRTAIPNTSGFTRPQAVTLAPAPLTPLPQATTRRTAPAAASSRTPVPLKTNPLQPPRLSEQTLVAPQQPQTRAPAPGTTTSAPARVSPPTPMVTVPVRHNPAPLPERNTDRPGSTTIATAPPTLRDPKREWEERRQRDERGESSEREERRDPGKASTRDDPYRCITDATEAEPVIGSRATCKAFRVYNRCSAPVDIRTCVYLTVAKKWSCEVKSVAPNAYKQHESCSPHGERFVSVKYADDHRTRLATPTGR